MLHTNEQLLNHTNLHFLIELSEDELFFVSDVTEDTETRAEISLARTTPNEVLSYLVYVFQLCSLKYWLHRTEQGSDVGHLRQV